MERNFSAAIYTFVAKNVSNEFFSNKFYNGQGEKYVLLKNRRLHWGAWMKVMKVTPKLLVARVKVAKVAQLKANLQSAARERRQYDLL